MVPQEASGIILEPSKKAEVARRTALDCAKFKNYSKGILICLRACLLSSSELASISLQGAISTYRSNERDGMLKMMGRKEQSNGGCRVSTMMRLCHIIQKYERGNKEAMARTRHL